jgi:hypothetical protein
MQSVAAIILDHILAITIIVRQAVTAVPVVRTVAVRVIGAVSPTVVRVHRRTAIVVMLAALLAVILILMTAAIVALHARATWALLLAAMIVVATGTVFSERRRCQTQACTQQCSSNMTFLHEYLVQRCKCAASMNHASCNSRFVAKIDTLHNLYIPCRANIVSSLLSRQSSPLSMSLKRSMKRKYDFRCGATSRKALLNNALMRLFALIRQCIHLNAIYRNWLIA